MKQLVGQLNVDGKATAPLLRGGPLQRAIIDLGRQTGWRVAHFPPIKTERGWRVPVGADGKGWPDLVLVRERVVVMEVKGDGDTMKPEQELWQQAFKLAGIETMVATPSMWRDGVIEEVLRRRAT